MPAQQREVEGISLGSEVTRDRFFTAIVATLSPALSVTYGSRWPVTLSGGYTSTFNYVRRRQFKRSAITIGLGLGWNK